VADPIKPIPTRYAGVLFRSGLEARYARLFDGLEVPWEYEPQGFDAGGTWYRPDFALFPGLGTLWAEIKPRWDNDLPGVGRWQKFAAWRPQPSRAALLVGVPAEGNTAYVIGGDEDAASPGNGPWEDDSQEWRPCPSGHHFDLTYAGTFRAKFAEDGCPYSDPEGKGQVKLEQAIEAARSARFGTGE
jgi:hypothetical protein